MKQYLYQVMPSFIKSLPRQHNRHVLLASSIIIPAMLFIAFPVLAQTTTPDLALPSMNQATPMPPATSAIPEKPLLGAPFPSMVGGSVKPPLPLSNQPMSISVQETQKNMDQIKSQNSNRLGELKTGIGLAPPDISGYTSELQEMAVSQRNTRLLQAKRQEAEAAMAVYGVLYDSRREEEAKKLKDIKDMKDIKDREEKEMRTEDIKQGPRLGDPSNAGVFSAQEMPLPKIVTLFGSFGVLKTVLLVPYVGEMKVEVGTILPGGRRVVRISSSGVIVKDPKYGNIALGYGDSVASMPPPVAPVTVRAGSGLSIPPPMGIPAFPGASANR